MSSFHRFEAEVPQRAPKRLWLKIGGAIAGVAVIAVVVAVAVSSANSSGNSAAPSSTPSPSSPSSSGGSGGGGSSGGSSPASPSFPQPVVDAASTVSSTGMDTMTGEFRSGESASAHATTHAAAGFRAGSFAATQGVPTYLHVETVNEADKSSAATAYSSFRSFQTAQAQRLGVTVESRGCSAQTPAGPRCERPPISRPAPGS